MTLATRKLCLLVAILSLDSVSHVHLASATAEFHTIVAAIQSVGKVAISTPGDP